MEQINNLLAVPTLSKSTVSSTQKAGITEDQLSFASVYEQNINDPEMDTSKKTAKPEMDSSKAKDVKINEPAEEHTAEEVVEKQTEKAEAPALMDASWQSLFIKPAEVENIETTDQIIAIEGEQVVDVQIAIAETAIKAEAPETANAQQVGSNPDVETFDSEISTETDTENDMVATPEMAVQTATVKSEKSVDNSMPAIKNEETKSNVVTPNSSGIAETDILDDVMAQSKVVVKPNMVNSTFETTTSQNELNNLSLPKLQESLMNQIENSLGKVIKTGTNEIRLQLEPENLGVLNIRIVAGKEGTNIVFKTDNLQSSQLLANQVDTLKTMMAESGIKVDQVLVNDFSFSQQEFNNQQQFEQQSSKNYLSNAVVNLDQTDLRENPYELPQTVVGLNYLV